MFFYILILAEGYFYEAYDNFEALAVDIATYLKYLGIRNNENIEIASVGKELRIGHKFTGTNIMLLYVGYENSFFIRYITPQELWELGKELGRWFRVDVVTK
jgi:hypothetical protein